MTEIKPFKALIYNQDKIKDISRVVCPPYDVISPEKQEFYHSLHPQNLIHILLARDIPGGDKYQEAGKIFRAWQKDEVLVQDAKPAIYFYTQEYNVRGEKKMRAGFIALLGLGDKDPSAFKHEHTRLEPRQDRLKLLRQVKANLSPIFVIFADKKRIIQSTYQQLSQNQEPFIDIRNDENIRHKLWRIDSADLLNSIQKKISAENIFIADGHHRYEVACAWRDEMKQEFPNVTGQEGFNYILAYFTNIDPRNLTILPVHRLLRLSQNLSLDAIKPGLSEYFSIEEFKDKTKFLFLLEKAGKSEHVLGIYKDKRYLLLRLKNIKSLDKVIPGQSDEYRSLDVSILNHLILEKILGLDPQDKTNLAFSPDAEEFIKQVDTGAGYILFILNPVKVDQILKVALKRERMPAKSTYFYPKVLSGLVINKLA